MKSRQLANVLIKITGLYVCLCAIPGVISGVLGLFASTFGVSKGEAWFDTLTFSIGDSVQAVVGIILIIKSRKIAEYWFKNEAE